MPRISFRSKGDWSKTTNFLKNIKINRLKNILDEYGKKGVQALSDATPKDTGKTANSWSYTTSVTDSYALITWENSNIVVSQNSRAVIALILQYGHGTRNGGYVQGRDYINPAMRPIFDEMPDKIFSYVKGE
jgi:hypothetical protein